MKSMTRDLSFFTILLIIMTEFRVLHIYSQFSVITVTCMVVKAFVIYMQMSLMGAAYKMTMD